MLTVFRFKSYINLYIKEINELKLKIMRLSLIVFCMCVCFSEYGKVDKSLSELIRFLAKLDDNIVFLCFTQV